MEDYYIAQFFCWREIILLNLEIDIETFSSVNLAKAGVYRYASDMTRFTLQRFASW